MIHLNLIKHNYYSWFHFNIVIWNLYTIELCHFIIKHLINNWFRKFLDEQSYHFIVHLTKRQRHPHNHKLNEKTFRFSNNQNYRSGKNHLKFNNHPFPVGQTHSLSFVRLENYSIFTIQKNRDHFGTSFRSEKLKYKSYFKWNRTSPQRTK